MKKVSFIAALILVFATTAMAQNNAYQSVVGLVTDASGSTSFVSPTTTIAIDITIQKEQTIVGPYARYAQKYLDTRGSLVEKSTYFILDADLSLATAEDMLYNPTPEPASEQILSHNGSTTEFAKILPDRTSNAVQSLDASAMDAAQQIFDIRKYRMELITGQAGENVFGAGLADALKALDEQEQALLELFFGKNIVSTHTERFYIAVDAEQKSYTLARFSKNTGLQEASANAGEVITLNIAPSGRVMTQGITPADAKAKSVMQIRCADLSECDVKFGDEVINNRTLPVFEFGKTITIAK